MTQQVLNLGSSANDGTGDTLRTGGEKINANFTELYTEIGIQNLFYVSTASNPFNADAGARAATFLFQGYDGSPQFRVETQANSVNWLTVRGGITGSMPVITTNGSDTNVPLSIAPKGLSGIFFGNGAGTHLLIDDLNNGAARNWLTIAGNISGSPVQIGSTGFDDTNVDISFAPMGTGVLRFGAHTSSTKALTADMTSLPATGSILIKDSSGTSRKLWVLA